MEELVGLSEASPSSAAQKGWDCTWSLKHRAVLPLVACSQPPVGRAGTGRAATLTWL